MSKSKLVNGPINVVRLEGTIHDIKKVLYIFMDIHTDVSRQTHCNDFGSLELIQYMVQQFGKSNPDKTFDLFTETTISAIKSGDYPYKGRYIDELNKYVRAKYKGYPHNKNVRAHYIDIRDYLKTLINLTINGIYEQIDNTPSNYFSKSSYDNIISLLDRLKQFVSWTSNEFTGESDSKSRSASRSRAKSKSKSELDNPGTIEQQRKPIRQIISKLLNKYTHPDLKASLDESIEDIKDSFAQIYKLIDETKELLDKSFGLLTKQSNTLNLVDYKIFKTYSYSADTIKILEFKCSLEVLITQLDLALTYNFARIVDLFFLRRFLDKNYITNGIVYTGAAHSVSYIYQLVNKFGFDITHAYYTTEPDMNILNKLIKKTRYNPSIEKIFLPDKFSQCIDMGNFPEGFE